MSGRYGDPPPPPTEAQINADLERRTGHPPIHEQHPLSDAEHQQVDEAAARLRSQKGGRRG